jgi:hypothetical protein
MHAKFLKFWKIHNNQWVMQKLIIIYFFSLFFLREIRSEREKLEIGALVIINQQRFKEVSLCRIK